MCGTVVSSLLFFLLFLVTACDRVEKKPYTPFGAATSAGPEAAPESSADSPKPPFDAPGSALSVKPPRREATVEGVRVQAPASWLLSEVLYVPSETATGRAYAWVVPEGDSGELGQLWQLLPEARKVADAPGFIPNAAGCKPKVALRKSGAQSLLLEVSTQCGDLPLPARSPTRSLQFFSPLSNPRLTLGLRAAAPSNPGDRVRFVGSSPDIDGDGTDDVSVEVRLRPRTGPPAQARWAWLARAAGVTREESEPGASFAAQARRHPALGSTPAAHEAVRAALDATRRAFAYLCQESGTAHVFDASGRALECGDMTSAGQELLELGVRSALRAQLPQEALFELERADWFRLTSPEQLRATVDKLRAEVLGTLKAKTPKLERLRLQPLLPGPAPQYSPLAFLDDGALLVQARDGLFEWRKGRVREVSDEIDPWPLIPAGPQQEQIAALQFPCSQATLSIQTRHGDGSVRDARPTAWLAPRPGLCQGKADFFAPTLTPIRFGPSGPVVQLGTLLVPERTEPGPGALGAPISPNGRSRVAETRWGALVLHARQPAELWRNSGAALSACTISNAPTQVACLQDGQAVLLRPEHDP